MKLKKVKFEEVNAQSNCLFEREVDGVFEREVDCAFEREVDGVFEREVDCVFEREVDGVFEREVDPKAQARCFFERAGPQNAKGSRIFERRIDPKAQSTVFSSAESLRRHG